MHCNNYTAQWWRSMQKGMGVKYSTPNINNVSPNINVYVLTIFTAFSLKSVCVTCPPRFRFICSNQTVYEDLREIFALHKPVVINFKLS